jgi:hypothetical protein
MGRIKPMTVSELMDIANRFANGEDACNNKRTRSPEDDRGNIYNSQRRRSRNYDNYGSHSQVAPGYKDNNYQGDDHRNSGYRSYGREDFGSNKRFQSKGSRYYNPSPDDMLNGSCHIHFAFVDGKRVSRHAMKDCKTFLKLQDVAGNKQAKARRHGYEVMKIVCPIFHDASPDPIDLIRSSNHVSNTRNLKMGNVNPASNSSM